MNFCGVWIAQHYAANINGYCSHFCAASIICIRSLLRHALGINLSSYLLFQDILAFFATKPRHVITTRRGFSAYRSLNVFVKPNDQRQTCLYLGMARKRRRCQQKLLCFARLCRLAQPRTNLLYSLGFAAWIVQELYCFLPFFLSHIWGDYPCG